MRSDEHEPEAFANLHAPWRMEYIRLLSGSGDGCFLCHARDDAAHEAENLVLWRTAKCIVLMNRFPYAGGHLLISPLEHVGELGQVPPETLTEMMALASDSTAVLAKVLRAEGFNIGLNIGRCAGAGLPGHLHLHVVPRWNNDTNFMAVLGDVRVIPQALEELRQHLLQEGLRMKRPKALYEP